MNPLLPEDRRHLVETFPAVWAVLDGARLFITGGTGFFGKWLLESLLIARSELNADLHATVLTRSISAFQTAMPQFFSTEAGRTITFQEGDIESFRFPQGPVSHILHAATPVSQKMMRERPEEILRITVNGTRRVLELAEAVKPRRLLLVSSGAVYGRQPSDLESIPETYAGAPDITQPEACYGEGKRLAEHMVCNAGRRLGFDALIARCFAFIGPHLPLDGEYAVGNFIRNAMEGQPIHIAGDGTPLRSYLYSADLTLWLWRILTAGEPSRPYNVGSEAAVSIRELAETVASVWADQGTLPIQIAKAPSVGSAPLRYVPSTQRARTELGLEQKISLLESVRRTRRWLETDLPVKTYL